MALYRMLIGDPLFKENYDASGALSEIVKGMWSEMAVKDMAFKHQKWERQTDLTYLFTETPFGRENFIGFKTVCSADHLVDAATADRFKHSKPYEWVVTDADYQGHDGKGITALRELKLSGITVGGINNARHGGRPIPALLSGETDAERAKERLVCVGGQNIAAYIICPVLEHANSGKYELLGRVIARHYLSEDSEMMLNGIKSHTTVVGAKVKVV